MAPKSASDFARSNGYRQHEAWFTKHNNELMRKLREKFLGGKPPLGLAPTHPSPSWQPDASGPSPPKRRTG